MKLQLLGNFLPIEKWSKEAKETAASVGYARHVPIRETIPEDLADKEGNFQVTDNGFPVAGRILPEDVNFGSQSPVLPLYVALYAVVHVLGLLTASMGIPSLGGALLALYFAGFFVLFGFWSTLGMAALTVGAATTVGFLAATPLAAFTGGLMNKFLTVTGYLPAFFPLIYLFLVKRSRASDLSYQADVYGGSALNAPKSQPNEARFEQAERAEKDKSYFSVYGNATGQFSFAGDEFAPDAGKAVGQTVNDQSTHLIIFGATGAGKTTNIRQVIKGQIDAEKASGKKTGMMVLDGKAVLASDCAHYLDVNVSTANTKNFNFHFELPPEVFTKIIVDQFAPKKSQSGNSSFFTARTSSLWFYSGVIQHAMVKCGTGKKSFMQFYKVGSQMVEPADEQGNHPISQALATHPDFGVEGTLLNDALQELVSLQNEPPETKQNIFATFKSWASPFIQSEHLRAWADSEETDFDFNQVCYGKKIGFVLPASQLGVAGTAISALMKARLFTLIANRGLKGEKWSEDGQTPVNLFVDEAQAIMDESDLTVLQQGRSLGFRGFYATQNYDNLEEKFGDKTAAAIFESFRSVICLKSSNRTYQVISNRIGKAKTWASAGGGNCISFDSTSRDMMARPFFDENNPERTWMRQFSQGIIAKVFGRTRVPGKNEHINSQGLRGRSIHVFQPSKEPMPILQEKHIQLLNTPFMAIAVVQRAGVERRDIIKTIPLNDKFEPIKQNKRPKGFTAEDAIAAKLFD